MSVWRRATFLLQFCSTLAPFSLFGARPLLASRTGRPTSRPAAARATASAPSLSLSGVGQQRGRKDAHAFPHLQLLASAKTSSTRKGARDDDNEKASSASLSRGEVTFVRQSLGADDDLAARPHLSRPPINTVHLTVTLEATSNLHCTGAERAGGPKARSQTGRADRRPPRKGRLCAR